MRLVHTSDVHLFAARPFESDLAMVRSLAATAASLEADLLAIAGDLFDRNRVPHGPANRLMGELLETGIPVVVLPGNHDPLTPGSIYRNLEAFPGLFVLGLHGPAYDRQGWSVTGRAHVDYGNFPPLDLERHEGPADGRIVLAHGHFDLRDEAGAIHRPGWLITTDDLDRTAAGYVGLGHWDRAFVVRPSGPPTWYSGSPWHAGTVNVVDLEPGQEARIERAPLLDGDRSRPR
jgi:DNA repair exonuclease SbcCD nuclease subunit